VLAGLIGGVAMLVVFWLVERHVDAPMFHLALFGERAFAFGNLATLLSSIARGGLQFMLIIWLQGVWLPLHGYDFESTPLWAGVYLVPLTIGFLLAGPLSGYFSDRFGARWFATGGLALAAISFVGLLLLPIDFSYPWFAALIALNGVGSGLFAAPNTSQVMGSVQPRDRGAASGMRATFMNAGMLLSIGIFFSLMIVGLARHLPTALADGLTAHGVPAATAHQIAGLPPVGSLFAAFLGYNPMQSLLGPTVLGSLAPGDAATVTGTTFFPQLISGPLHDGLVIVFVAAALMCLLGAAASAVRLGPRRTPSTPEAVREQSGSLAATPR
jgi:MFS family permease